MRRVPFPREDRWTTAVPAVETRASCVARPLPPSSACSGLAGWCRVGGGAFTCRAPGALVRALR
eukprot:4535472-Alexandrium_andersonii.AAC.1